MKILKLKLFQETACYKKPFSFKVLETFPLPPYSTVIGMLHKLLNAKSGEYYDMNISIQGKYESRFSNYQKIRTIDNKGNITTMPRNVHELLNINLILHVMAEDEVIQRIYNNIVNQGASVILGRNEDIARIDSIEIMDLNLVQTKPEEMTRYNIYVPIMHAENNAGINYRLNTKYVIKDNLRKWDKVDVKYIESDTTLFDVNVDKDGDVIEWYKQ